MAIVYAPNPETEGLHAGVEFVSGAGETSNPGALVYFQRAGYRIEDVTSTTVGELDNDEPTEVERPARSAKVAEWRAYAESQGVDYSGLSKDELIEALDNDEPVVGEAADTEDES